MRKIITLTISFFVFLISSAESSASSSYISLNRIVCLIVQPQSGIVPVNSVQKKMNLKERLLLKWHKKKSVRIISEEEEKKKIKLLGKLSLWSILLAFVLIVVPLGFFLSILLVPASLILGIISLKRRNKLADKSGVSKWPALIGIIVSSLVILIFGSYLLYYGISGSD